MADEEVTPPLVENEEETAEVVEFVPRVILGGRTLEAMKVREKMDEVFVDLKNEYEHPSGFLIVVFNEEGYGTSQMFFGDRFPLPPTEITPAVAELIRADLWKSTE